MLIDDIFKDFIINHKSAVLSKLKTSSGDYRRLLESRTRQSASLLTLIKNVPELMELLQDYTGCTNEIQDIESDALYLQGVKDGFRLSSIF